MTQRESDIRYKIQILKQKVKEWDEIADSSASNKHDLSSSERTDWLEEIDRLGKKLIDLI